MAASPAPASANAAACAAVAGRVTRVSHHCGQQNLRWIAAHVGAVPVQHLAAAREPFELQAAAGNHVEGRGHVREHRGMPIRDRAAAQDVVCGVVLNPKRMRARLCGRSRPGCSLPALPPAHPCAARSAYC
jgi:hypothetical protein